MQNTNPKHDRDPQPLSDVIDDAKSTLGWILRKAARIQQANAILHEILDSPLNDNCHVMDIIENTMVIATSSASWATRLRMQQYDLVNRLAFHNQWRYIQRLEIKVR